MEFKTTYRSTPDDIQHWKYVKKVRKNGKWRYYYDEDSVRSDVNKAVDTTENILDVAKAETSRAVDNASYDNVYKAIQVDTTASLQEIERTMPDGFEKKAQKFVTNAISGIARLSINILKKLNNSGDGTADNRLIEKVEKGKRWLDDLLSN